MATVHAAHPLGLRSGRKVRRERRLAKPSLKLWLGVFFGLIAAALAIGAFIFIWFGVFPGLAFLLVCLPIAALSLHLVRVG